MRILFFSPYQFIDVHAIPEALVGEALSRRGHEIVQVTCQGIFGQFCISMAAAGLNEGVSDDRKADICVKCKRRGDQQREQFGFKQISIDSSLDERDLSEVRRVVNQVTPENWVEFEYRDILVARYAAYEFVLNHKLNTIEIPEKLWSAYLIHLGNAMKTLLAGEKLLEKLRPDRVVTYNSFYSCNRIMCAVADRLSISHFTLHAGSHHVRRLSEMTIFRGLTYQNLITRLPAWPRYVKLPLTRARFECARDHVDELLQARSPWVYSTKSDGRHADDLRGFFGIQPDQKVLLVAMASADERFGATLAEGLPPDGESIFSTQMHWIEFVINWVSSRPELFLIIRVHPREFPNKREKVLSAQALKLQGSFNGLPENVRVNWPEDEISLHDLARFVDVGLNATSTSGLELLLFGVPVVTHVSIINSYPKDLNLCATTETDYIEKIQEAINEGINVDRAYGVYQWLAFRSEVVAIDISDGYSDERKHGRYYEMTERINKVRQYFGKSEVIPGLALFRWRRLKNSAWLAYAIENDVDSHIEAYTDWLERTSRNGDDDGFSGIAEVRARTLAIRSNQRD